MINYCQRKMALFPLSEQRGLWSPYWIVPASFAVLGGYFVPRYSPIIFAVRVSSFFYMVLIVSTSRMKADPGDKFSRPGNSGPDTNHSIRMIIPTNG